MERNQTQLLSPTGTGVCVCLGEGGIYWRGGRLSCNNGRLQQVGRMQSVQMWQSAAGGSRKMTVMAAIIIGIVIISTTAANTDSMLTMCQEVF